MTDRISILLLINLLFFCKTITYRYVSDDIPVSLQPKHPNKFIEFLRVLIGSARSSPQADHLITTTIHSLTAVFMYTGFGASDISFLAAVLFSLNPINNQGSVWISGRGYVVPTLCLLLVLTFPLISPVFLAIATYYNVGFLAPVILLASNVPLTFLSVPIFWFVHLKRFKTSVKAKIEKEMFTEDKAIKPEKIVLVLKSFGFYVSHTLIPFKTTFYHSFLQSAAGAGRFKAYNPKDRFFALGVALVGTIAWYLASHPWDMISFSILWACWGFAPFLNFRRMSQEIAERYAYFPSVGIMYILACLIHGNPYLTAGFIAMYATKLWFYMDAYQDDYYIAEAAALNSPDSWFALHVKAMKRWDVKSYQEALILWEMARVISPKEFKILWNIATVLYISGHQAEAKAFMDEAMANIPPGQETQSKDLYAKFLNNQCSVLL